jgi:hypothetical protein
MGRCWRPGRSPTGGCSQRSHPAELAVEATDQVSIRLTAKVIAEVDADIIGVVEAEDRPALARFNRSLVGLYRHVMLVDGNDERGIDVAPMTKTGFDIVDVRSHVDDEDDTGLVFSRDCADYRLQIPGGGTCTCWSTTASPSPVVAAPSGPVRPGRLREIVDELVADGEPAVVMGTSTRARPTRPPRPPAWPRSSAERQPAGLGSRRRFPRPDNVTLVVRISRAAAIPADEMRR